jgi:hypothetical protein
MSDIADIEIDVDAHLCTNAKISEGVLGCPSPARDLLVVGAVGSGQTVRACSKSQKDRKMNKKNSAMRLANLDAKGYLEQGTSTMAVEM